MPDHAVEPHAHVRQMLRAHHADLVQDQPPPLSNRLGNAHVPLEVGRISAAALHRGNAACMVDRVASKNIGHDGLESPGLELDADVPP